MIGTKNRKLIAFGCVAVEIWKPVLGYEGFYEASSLGRIRSVTRWVHNRKTPHKSRIRKFTVSKGRYYQVNLCRQSKHTCKPVHLLVASAFHGKCPKGLECRHLDGNSFNNKSSNLKWGTRKENLMDQVDHGTVPGAKLTKSRILYMRKIYKRRHATLGLSGLSRMYGVAASTISRVLNNVRWARI